MFRWAENNPFRGKEIIDPSLYLSPNPGDDKDPGDKPDPEIGKRFHKDSLFIMLADDDEDDREMFAEAIAELHMNTVLEMVEDGSELLHNLKDSNLPLPHMIFLDLNMPKKNGKECLAEIRKDPRLKNIPVIVYSTSSSMYDIDETFNRGANLFVRKPSSFTELVQIARNVLELNWEQYKPHGTRSKFLFNAKPNK